MTPAARILVVDDYAPSRYGFRRILAMGGYTVFEAADGARTLAVLDDEIDAIVLDVNLPDVNGIELCRRIKERRPALPVILISSSYQAAARESEWQPSGASAFLEQPIDAEQLIATLERLLNTATPE